MIQYQLILVIEAKGVRKRMREIERAVEEGKEGMIGKRKGGGESKICYVFRYTKTVSNNIIRFEMSL